MFGAQTISGVVIAVDGPYLAKRQTDWKTSVFKGLIFVGVVVPVVIAVSIAGRMLSLAWSLSLSPSTFGRSKSKQGSLATEFGRQLSVSYVMTRIFRPQEEIPVRDVRLRDAGGQEHLIRIRGELVHGGLGVGDEVELTGVNRQGTLLLRTGWNRRTRSKLVVRER